MIKIFAFKEEYKISRKIRLKPNKIEIFFLAGIL